MPQAPQVTPNTPDPANSDNLNRDPEDRPTTEEQSVREKMMEKTLADTPIPAATRLPASPIRAQRTL